MTKGTITHLRPSRDDGRGFGMIAPGMGGVNVWFDNGSMEGSLRRVARGLRGLLRPEAGRERPFDRLRVGQPVRFRTGEHPTQPHRAYAARLCPVESEAGAEVGEHPDARVAAPDRSTATARTNHAAPGASGIARPSPLAGRALPPSLPTGGRVVGR